MKYQKNKTKKIKKGGGLLGKQYYYFCNSSYMFISDQTEKNINDIDKNNTILYNMDFYHYINRK
jgi:uncharacterized protein (UPF0262 family)